ncbi:MAG: hypothetical protein AB7O62_22590 [Pirellulales bacterium]
MNCDQAFDHLTLTVPPADGHALAQHLAGCPRCRSLAETLEPALELFRADAEMDAGQTFANENNGGAPDWPACHETATPPNRPAEPQQPAVPLSRHGHAVASWSDRPIWQVVAALIVGVFVGGTVWGIGAVSQRGANGATEKSGLPWPGSLLSVRPGQADGPAAAWAGIRLSDDCQAIPAAGDAPAAPAHRLLGEIDRTSLACCTRCHSAGRASTPSGGIWQIAMSCQACHQP